MIKSAITVSLVEEARGGPFVFWNGLSDAFSQAAALGFDGIEIFAPGPEAVDRSDLKALCEKFKLPVAAVGTGAGMVKHGLSLTDPDRGQRGRAREFIRSMIDFGGAFQAPAIIGSMQGRWGGNTDRQAALELLGEALQDLGAHAEQYSVPLLYEPLNRYETNLLKTIAEGVDYLRGLGAPNVQLLADLFHMNIEESDLASAIRAGAGYVGHLHFVDSNRQAAGLGHIDYAPIVAAIREINFQGYCSAEVLPLPDAATAARKTMDTFQQFFR